MERISAERLDSLGISVKRVRKQLFSQKIAGVPEDLVMYWVKSRGGVSGEIVDEGTAPGA